MSDDSHGADDLTRTLRGPSAAGEATAPEAGAGGQAMLILIAHPEHQRLGSRTPLEPGEPVEVGRDPSCTLAFPEVRSLSRVHARVGYVGDTVVVEDLGSTNGTFVNDRRLAGPAELVSGDRLQVGALHFKFFREADVEAAYHLAIHQLVMQDGLTEIANRRRFDDELAREFARAGRHQRPLALVVFDIDRFKEVNDRLGHLSGDSVLKGIAAVCRRRLRPEQVFARLGGDEFAIISPETGLEGAMILAGRLREAVAEHRFDPTLLPADLRVTCSFGCAEMSPAMHAPSELLEAADRALYDAKEAGRNRVAPL
ncbi:MAG TPA: GGDEF domain-containing protein [Methylomirabilota bacterium]|nr:GGDEF domain-containing protein [Methylomirabilota bacterium]